MIQKLRASGRAKSPVENRSRPGFTALSLDEDSMRVFGGSGLTPHSRPCENAGGGVRYRTPPRRPPLRPFAAGLADSSKRFNLPYSKTQRPRGVENPRSRASFDRRGPQTVWKPQTAGVRPPPPFETAQSSAMLAPA